MGTEDETELTLQGRATAAAGAALVAACIVNPLDVIKTRIQAQAMAEASGQRGCSTPWTCTSTLYEHAAQHQHSLHHHTHGLSECQHSQHAGNPAAARPWLPQRHTHTLCPEAHSPWVLNSNHSSSSTSKFGSSRALGFPSSSRSAARLMASPGSSSSAASAAAAAAAAAISAARSAAADKAAAAAAAFRRWGITEGPVLPIRRTPPFPVPYGWSPAPVTAALAAAAPPAGVLPASASAAAALASSCPACVPHPSAVAGAAAAGALPANSNSMWEMAKAIRAREGLPVLWRGTSASLLIAVPMVGIYMPLYDSLLDSWSSKLGSLAPVVSGTAARTAACFCVAPFELLRTRIQASAASGVSMRSTLSSFVTEHQQHSAATAAAAAGAQPQPQQLLQQAVRGAVSSSSSPAAVGQAPKQAMQQLAQLQQQQQAAQATQQIKLGAVLRAVPRMWTGFSATLVRDVPFSALYWALVEPLRQAMLPVNSHWAPLQQLDDMLHRRRPHPAAAAPAATNSSVNSASSGSPGAQQQQQLLTRSPAPSNTPSSSGSVPPSQARLMHHSQVEILVANMVSGFVAGGLAAGATTPFDVVKTRMQIASPSQQLQQEAGASGGSGGGRLGSMRVFRILGEVYKREGMEGLFSGLKPRAARAAPACAIVISVYELLKSYLTPAL